MGMNEGSHPAASRFSDELMFAAASAYYLHNQNQGETAEALGVSRPTVSRLLSEARRRGIVEIQVHRPVGDDFSGLESECARALNIDLVYVVGRSGIGSIGAQMAAGVKRALEDANLSSGESLLISSGRTLYEVGMQTLVEYPGILVAPTVGGLQEPEPWWQTNELTRRYAERLSGRPVYLYAPALPSPLLRESLKAEPSFQRILHMWDTAKAALLGIGAPPLLRSRTATFFPSDEHALRNSAGDISSRFFDAEGEPMSYAGSERVVATTREQLRRIPASIGVAAGAEKVVSMRAAARGGWINRLVTDANTARLLSSSEQ